VDLFVEEEILTPVKRTGTFRGGRVLSGYRPSGRLHLGHYFGTLTNWIRLQHEFECFFFVADWHALTTIYEDTSQLQNDIQDMVLDWLAVGLDPEKCKIYRQSDLPEVAELALYLSMLTPLPWLERNPTYKDQMRELKGKEIATHGFLGYPVLQAADILLVQGQFVPVGEDQLSHLELAREIVRRFNNFYGQYFTEPQPLLSPAKKIIGTDGRKMSKSYNNAIYLTDSPTEVKEKTKIMITDPARIRVSDPGHPEVCSVYWLHQIVSEEILSDIKEKCMKGQRGCVACKSILAETVNSSLEDFRDKRKELEEETDLLEELLARGAKQVKPVAHLTIEDVRKRINIRE